MLNTIITEEALEDFLAFWQTHFPEQQTLTREAALTMIDDKRRGYANIAASDQEMIAYQDDVSRVYGAYENLAFQLATIVHIIRHVKRLPDASHIVSLGCGPASYELWLATQTGYRFTLVDHSQGMLDRARAIAATLGIADRVTIIQSDARSVPSVPSHSADLVFCLNSMHWSRNWREWITEAARIVKRRAPVLVTCTFFMPRSTITPQDLGEVMSRYFQNEGAGSLVPPVDVGGGVAAVSGRFYAIGRRHDRPQKPQKKKRKR